MDPELANLDFDPPRQPSPLRRGLLPALLVNAVFFACVAWSLNWPGANPGRQEAARSDDTRTMGAAPAPSAPEAPAAQQATPLHPPPQVQVPPQPQMQPQRKVNDAAPPAAAPMGAATRAAPEPRVEPAARPASRPKRRAVQNEAAPTRQATGVAVQASFDCTRAMSRSERLICGDAELAQLDRDTGRLHARAKAAARDPGAFRRQNDREWKQREADCRDKACLLAWYAHRREQLQETVAQAR